MQERPFIRRVRPADGSIVTLDADTRLQLQFTEEERRLELLDGRAWRLRMTQRGLVVAADGRTDSSRAACRLTAFGH